MNQYYGTTFVKRTTPPNDELKHWKYIKREKKNGKWVYYYDKEQLKDDLGFDEKARYEDAKRVRNNHWQQEEKYFDKFENFMRVINNPYDDKDAYSDFDSDYELADKFFDTAMTFRKMREEKDKEVTKLWNEYRRTPIGKIDEVFGGAIRKGKAAVEDLFDRIKSKKNKK